MAPPGLDPVGSPLFFFFYEKTGLEITSNDRSLLQK